MPLPVPLFQVGPFVVLLLALGKPDLEFGATSRPVQVQRSHGVTSAFDLADQGCQFAAVKQQLATARGFGVDVSGSAEHRIDVRTYQPGFAVLENHVSLGNLRTPGAQRLDLPPLQDQPSLVLIFDLVFVAGTSVGRDLSRCLVVFLGHRKIICSVRVARPVHSKK